MNQETCMCCRSRCEDSVTHALLSLALTESSTCCIKVLRS